MQNNITPKERLEKFTDELSELSKKYGVLLSSTGGVRFYDAVEDIQKVIYSKDATSGDLNYYIKFKKE